MSIASQNVCFLTQSGHSNHAPRKTGFAALARKHNNAGVCPDRCISLFSRILGRNKCSKHSHALP